MLAYGPMVHYKWMQEVDPGPCSPPSDHINCVKFCLAVKEDMILHPTHEGNHFPPARKKMRKPQSRDLCSAQCHEEPAAQDGQHPGKCSADTWPDSPVVVPTHSSHTLSACLSKCHMSNPVCSPCLVLAGGARPNLTPTTGTAESRKDACFSDSQQQVLLPSGDQPFLQLYFGTIFPTLCLLQ